MLFVSIWGKWKAMLCPHGFEAHFNLGNTELSNSEFNRILKKNVNNF
jgi:hypothetical protein